LFELLKNANERHEVYHIRYKNGDAVLMSQDEYDSLQETLALLSSAEFQRGFLLAQQEAKSGDTVSFEEVFGEPQ
jgi:antitoxin YefM